MAPTPRSAPTLARGQVALRAHREDDADRIVEQCRDPDMVRWTTVPSPYGRSEAAQFLAARAPAWADGSNLSFAITHRGEFAGTIDLTPDRCGGAEIGFGLHPAARGQHVGSTALRLCLEWAFETLELEVVHWRAAVGNWPSRRLAWGVGFQVEGTVRDLLVDRGRRCDGWIGSLRRGDPLAPPQVWLDPVRLAGRGLWLRPHAESDLDRTVQACNDPVTRHWLPQIPNPYRRADAVEHLHAIADDHAAGRALCWAVADPDDRIVAEIGLFGLRAGLSRWAEIGYWTHPDHRRRGVSSEAVRLAARHALLPREDGGLGLSRVLIQAADDNLGSQRVAQQAGFRACGRERDAELLGDGTIRDGVRFDLLAADLPAPQRPAGSAERKRPKEQQ